MRSPIVLAIVMLAIAACSSDDEVTGPAPAAIEDHPCAVQLPMGFTDDDVRCASVTVPLDRDDPQGAEVTVEFAVVLARSSSAEPDPLVLIPGGPGNPILDRYFRTDPLDLLAQVDQTRDLVYFDPRGTGHSTPDLSCPEWQATTNDSIQRPDRAADELAARLEAMRTCHDRLVAAGTDLSHFHSASIAADVAAGMTALGYESYNVWAWSYGGRVAQELLRSQPEGVRSVILDAPSMPELSVTNAQTVKRALDHVFANCAASASCSQQSADLESQLYTAIETLNQTPVETSVSVDGQPTTIYVTGDRFAAGVVNALYQNALISVIPSAISSTAEGNLAIIDAFAPQLVDTDSLLSRGHRASVFCSERAPFFTRQMWMAQNQGINPSLVESLSAGAEPMKFGQCDFWEVDARGAEAIEPVQSDVPALVLSGVYDPVSPDDGSKAAQNLSNAQHFVFPGYGHPVLGQTLSATGDSCEQQLMSAFLADPTSPVDGSCVEALSDPFQ